MRKGFVVYFDNKEQFEMLTDEQCGALFKAMLHFASEGKEPEFSDPVLKIAFSFLRGQILRDTEKYEETCRKNAENGRKGGRPKKSESDTEKPKKTDRFFDEPKKANISVNVNTNVNGDTSVCDTVSAHTNVHTHAKKAVELSADDLTVDIVRQMAYQQGFVWKDDECSRFIDYNRDAGRASGWDYAVKQWERNRPRFERTSWKGQRKKQLSQQELDELNEYLELSNRFEEEVG